LLYAYNGTGKTRLSTAFNKHYFRKILRDFIQRYPFNPALFASETEAAPKP
jgi:hypothetical protein